jgi:hypothetical protein
MTTNETPAQRAGIKPGVTVTARMHGTFTARVSDTRAHGRSAGLRVTDPMGSDYEAGAWVVVPVYLLTVAS